MIFGNLVIPAEAGTHSARSTVETARGYASMGPVFRRDDGYLEKGEA